jgi:hypothetical protein
MGKLNEQEIRKLMEELLADQMARPSLRPSTRLEDEAEAFAQETPRMAETPPRQAKAENTHVN